MSLQIEQQEKENRELELTVHVDEERVEMAMRKVAKDYARKLRIPGFRPGKAPYSIVRNWMGPEALRGEAVESLTQEIYQEALEEVDVEPSAPAILNNVDLDPLVLHLTVPLTPKVDLGNYRDVRVDPIEVPVNDEAVDKSIEQIQEAHVLLEPADRPSREGDVVIADFKAVQDGSVLIDREGAELLLDPAKLYPDIPFVENIVGMAAGDEKEFVIDVKTGEDKAEDAGDGEETAEPSEEEPKVDEKTVQVTYTVKVHEVKSRFVPPVNEDLAKEEGFETLLEMRIDTRKKLTEQARRQADSEYVDKVFEAIREGASVVYPPAALEVQIDQRIQELEQRFKQQGWSVDDYLKAQGKTPQTLRDEIKPQAEEQLIRDQISIALVTAEKLSVKKQDIDQLLEERLNQTNDYKDEIRQQLRDFYSAPDSRRWLANDALMTKFSNRLKAIGEGKAPDLSELLDEDEEE